jgi:anti-anti-sigma factor
MSHSRFELSERQIASGCLEIGIGGELDLAVADRLAEAIARCGEDQILIDLTDCEFIDSTGIAVIVRAHRARANDGGGRIVAHSPSHQVRRVLGVTGLLGNGLVFESLSEALGEPAPNC